EDGIRDLIVTGVQTCALPIYASRGHRRSLGRYEDRRPRPGKQNERGRVLYVALQTDEGQSAGGGGCAPNRQIRQDRHRAGPGLRSEERRVGKECRTVSMQLIQ